MARVERLFVNFTGTTVQAGQPLAELYSPELYQALQELLIAQWSAQPGSYQPQSTSGWSLLGDSTDLVRLAREKLALWGITPAQIDSILAKGQADPIVSILAPIGGVVVKKDVVEGQYVSEGEAMFEVADLGHVWVQAQVYEHQLPLVRVGQQVEASMSAFPGEPFSGQVEFIDPVLDPTTRTVNVRYNLPNPDDRIRPGMYATVTLKAPIAEVPAFRARLVKTRPAGGPLKLASLTADEQKTCPVTGEELGSMGDPVPVELAGRKVWVCCGGCPPKLRAEPAKYLARLGPPPADGVLSVPELTVIDTGDRAIVYVEAGPGIFEGRQVVLGPRIGDRFPVLDGLQPGDKVAAAGAFLIDAESRLNSGVATADVGGSGPLTSGDGSSSRAAVRTEGAHRH